MPLEIFVLKRYNIDPIISESGTDTITLKITNHGMQTGEMILNSTRNSLGKPASRAVNVIDANTLELNYFIQGQTSGDQIFLFKYFPITNMAANSFRLTKQIEKSGNCSFSILVDSAESIPKTGQQILVKYNNTVIFGGAISDIKQSIVGVANNGHKIKANISSKGYNHIPARRSITVDYPNFMTSGQIVIDMINTYLSAEGITEGTVQDGADWDEYPADFPDKCISVKTVLDDMANKSGYKWYIDNERRLHFLQNDVVVDAAHQLKDH